MQIISFKKLKSYDKTNLDSDEFYLLYCIWDKKNEKYHWSNYLNLLPQNLQNEVLKYKNYQDQYNCLLGKLLVLNGYYMFYGKMLDFSLYKRDKLNKPFISNNFFNFNISHSANVVVCIFSKQDIGIDIEEINEVNFKDFENVFSASEMEKINKYGKEKFYKFWTAKESVSKAIGEGLYMSYTSIKIKDGFASHKNTEWFVNNFKIKK
ncbi:4'-phosphopantetheinyl transferase family protein [Aquimarina algiphila]|uniref:4'-phosphopantetheinyl transferase family protein n=1 Tax=Aquimarina algiphila TaxID=2047982 RepID=UPI00232CB73B|nr:4'-phosphopantetheinyl transferase superfamily protein [Aquimarina algiphila]